MQTNSTLLAGILAIAIGMAVYLANIGEDERMNDRATDTAWVIGEAGAMDSESPETRRAALVGSLIAVHRQCGDRDGAAGVEQRLRRDYGSLDAEVALMHAELAQPSWAEWIGQQHNRRRACHVAIRAAQRVAATGRQ